MPSMQEMNNGLIFIVVSIESLNHKIFCFPILKMAALCLLTKNFSVVSFTTKLINTFPPFMSSCQPHSQYSDPAVATDGLSHLQ